MYAYVHDEEAKCQCNNLYVHYSHTFSDAIHFCSFDLLLLAMQKPETVFTPNMRLITDCEITTFTNWKTTVTAVNTSLN